MFGKPAQSERLEAVADALVFLHTTSIRNCASLPRISAKLGQEKGLVHESAHAWYRLQDEYCCDSNYKPQPCVPNIYGTLAACEADAPNLGYPLSYCEQLTKGMIVFAPLSPALASITIERAADSETAVRGGTVDVRELAARACAAMRSSLAPCRAIESRTNVR